MPLADGGLFEPAVQSDLQRIGGEYEIPFDEEIKWSDLWTRERHPRNRLIASMSETRQKGYYRRIFETAVGKESTLFMFTVKHSL